MATSCIGPLSFLMQKVTFVSIDSYFSFKNKILLFYQDLGEESYIVFLLKHYIFTKIF